MFFKKAILGFGVFLFLSQTSVGYGKELSDPLEEVFRKVSVGMTWEEVGRVVQAVISRTEFKMGTFQDTILDLKWQGDDLLEEGEKPWSGICAMFSNNRLVGAHYIFNYARRLVENRIKGNYCYRFE